ncbi:Protein Smaug -like protein 2 [Trichinella spiralis]|uniref:Protein Smaug-like protein 2 n=1 Tax=Trichinella spiralis TaxID=6334 RepID=A0A0V1BM53_TRISP|nr:Protein Smaug -like protein 2 [Trichinella spiralis]
MKNQKEKSFHSFSAFKVGGGGGIVDRNPLLGYADSTVACRSLIGRFVDRVRLFVYLVDFRINKKIGCSVCFAVENRRGQTLISRANSNMSTLETNRNGYYPSYASAWRPAYGGSNRLYNNNNSSALATTTTTTTTTGSQSLYNYWKTPSALLSPGGSSSNSSSGYEGGSASGNGSVNGGCLWSTTASCPSRAVQFPLGSTAPHPFASVPGCQDCVPISLCSFSPCADGVIPLPRQLHDQIGGCLLDCRKEMEHNANDSGYLSKLFSRTPVSKLAVILLRHLSLLKIDSEPAKRIYLEHLYRIIRATVDNEFHKDACMQLILHFIIHPAIRDDERLALKEESQLRNRCSSRYESEGQGKWSQDYSSLSTLSSTCLNPISTFESPVQTAAAAPPPSYTSSPQCQNRCLLTPQNHHINNFFNNDFTANMVGIDKPNVVNKKSSFSSNSSYNTDGSGNYHCRPGPSGYMNMKGDTGDVFTLMNNFDSRYLSDVYNYRRSNSPAATKMNFANAASFEPAEEAMRDVPQWLKMLRLHKYTPLFSKITYDHMMSFTEEKLELLGFYQSGSLRATLNELKCICMSPIRCYHPPNDGGTEFDQEKIEGFHSLPDEIDDDNIPAHFTRILGKICTQLLVTSEIEEDCVQICTEILEKCTNHPAFTEAQKKRLSNCRHELRKILYISKATMANDRMRGSIPNNNNRERRQHAQRKFSLQAIQQYNNNNGNGRNKDLASKSNVKRSTKNKRSNRPVDGQRFNSRLPPVKVECARVAEAQKPLTISCSNYNNYARPTAQTTATQSTNVFQMQPANPINHHHSISNYATNVNPMFSTTTTTVPQQTVSSITDEKNSFIFASDHQLSSWNSCASNFDNTTKRNIGLSDNGCVNQGCRYSTCKTSSWDHPINFSSGLDQLCRSMTEAALEVGECAALKHSNSSGTVTSLLSLLYIGALQTVEYCVPKVVQN